MLIADQKERMDLLISYTEPRRSPRAAYFYKLIHDFQELYGLTFGNDPYYGSVYEAVKSSQDQFLEQSLEAQKSIEDHISASEEKITKQIKNNSLKGVLFGNKKRTTATVIALVFIAVAFGAILQLGSILTRKVAESSAATITADFDNHILLDLANANHQYEVGLENWRRLDYNRAERDITTAKKETSKELANTK
jgi:hypothetical protein